ncbi:hypothetical protein N7490_003976 [Penicillium lividum]|nr:hypothetical protein N7490_003976 [Penicillium lividum]
MDTSLHVVSPKSHNIYFNLQGDSYCPPISGIINFKPHYNINITASTKLSTRLVRTIKSNASPAATCQRQGLLECMRRRITKTELGETNRTCSALEEATQPILPLPKCQLKGSSRGSQIIQIPFIIPIPVDIPGSVITELGEITYDIVASVTTEDETIATTRHPIHLSRQAITDEPTIQHARSYPNSKMVTQITLSQHLKTSLSDLSFAMSIKLRNPSTPGERASELKCSAIRGIRCRVEEVTKIYNKCDRHNTEGNEAEPERVSVREICNGRQKTHWGIIENPAEAQLDDAQRSGSVDVVFGFSIPKSVNHAQRTDLSCYAFNPERLDPVSLPLELQEYYVTTSREPLVMTVEHRLRLDLLTGEDTFQRGTMILVDRKPIRVALNASFPLLISECNGKNTEPVILERHPPRYEEVPTAPPNYDTHAGSSDGSSC